MLHNKALKDQMEKKSISTKNLSHSCLLILLFSICSTLREISESRSTRWSSWSDLRCDDSQSNYTTERRLLCPIILVLKHPKVQASLREERFTWCILYHRNGAISFLISSVHSSHDIDYEDLLTLPDQVPT